MEDKYKIIAIISTISTILLGEFDIPLQTLVLLIAIDYFTGLLVAGVYKSSLKSNDGRLSSNAGFKGILKKGMMFVIVLVAYRLDLLAGTNIVRNTTIMAFIINEIISINENAVLMGVDVPSYFTDFVERLRK